MSGKKGDAEKLAWLRLAGINWLGATVKAGLLKEFTTPQRVFSASKSELSKVKGWDFKRLDRFINEASFCQPVCPLELLENKNVRMVTYNDDDYPPLLREIPDSPVVLFSTGNIKLNNKPTIAIIGARRGTQLGYDIARDFSRELAKAGFIIVSGLALGIDTYAHRGALEGEGQTIAVLGGGPDVVYPKGNRRVREEILKKGGAVISEYAPSVIPRPWHFPIRNRIISGMCIGTLVIEASARSGSLITARLSAEQNREVFAVPGSIRSKNSEGTLNLIQEGATLVTNPKEIITYFSDLLPKTEIEDEKPIVSELTNEEAKLVKILSIEPISLDNLLDRSDWKRERLFSLLLSLEMRDYLTRLPGNFYQAKL